MTTIALPMTHPRTRSTLSSLAWIESKRFARHPIFLVGLALATLLVIQVGGGVDSQSVEVGPTVLDFQVIPAFFIGVFGFVVAARLTWSTKRSREVIEGAPASETLRTAALCLACLVPLTAGVALVIVHAALLTDPPAAMFYGTYGRFDRVLIMGVIPAVASLGGPLLGVAFGRWLRFPGAVLLGVVVLLVWCNLAAYMKSPEPSLAARVLHMFSPYTAFVTTNGNGRQPTTEVASFTGAPGWFALWLVLLCGLAITAALWRGAEGATRRLVGRTFVGFAVAALVCLGLAGTGGNERIMITTPDGVSRAATNADML